MEDRLRWDWLSGGDALHRRAEGKAVAKFFLEVVHPKMEALDEAAAIKWNDLFTQGLGEFLNPWKKKVTKDEV